MALTAEELANLRPGDELVIKDTSNGKELQGFYRSTKNNGELLVFMTRFNAPMRFLSSGVTGLGRFSIIRKVGL